MVLSLKRSSAAVNDASARRSAALTWFDGPLGRSLQAVEAHRLRTVLPGLYGCNALQVGSLGKLDLIDTCAAPMRVLLDIDNRAPTATGTAPQVEQMLTGARTSVVGAQADALPFDTNSLDLVLLPHTLDFCDDPHPVLREVSRVLRPEGHVVILGFNPISLWGIRRLFAHRSREAPWCGHFFSLPRVKDWLALLDFECTHGAMLYYRPPARRETTLERLYFMEKAGDRWWPMMAAVYLVVAKKRVLGMTPLPVTWKTPKRSRVMGSEPAVRGMSHSWHRRMRRHG